MMISILIFDIIYAQGQKIIVIFTYSDVCCWCVCYAHLVCLFRDHCMLLTACTVGMKNTHAVNYNGATRNIFYVPGFYIVSHMFVSLNVPTCETVISNLMYKCMCRSDEAENCIIDTRLNPMKSCTGTGCGGSLCI